MPHDEADCMDVLHEALIKYLSDKNAQVRHIKNPGNIEHLCQFSGGGDLFINKKASSMVIYY